MNIEADMTEEPKKSSGADKSEFTEEIFATVCERMAEGEGLREICRDPEMPSRSTVLRWVENDTGRQAKYQKAREALMDFYAEEIRTIAWDDSQDTIKRESKPDLCNHEWINRSRLKVDTLKFLMAKLHPKRYGEKTQVEIPLEEPKNLTVSWVRREIVCPIHDDDGGIINLNDNAALRRRIGTLEERLGMREPEPQPPRLITYDPGPLPSRTEGEILYSIAQAIKRNVPKADQRSPEEVISEVMAEFEAVLKAKYAASEAA